MAYEFIIKNQTDDAEDIPVASPSGNGSKKASKEEKKKKSDGQLAVSAGLVAWNVAKPWVTQAVSHEVNMVELRTGRREYAQKTQLTYQIANDVVGLGESILAGYAIGNIPGAIIGAITNVGHTIVNIAQKQNRIDTEKTLENITISQNVIRAGTSGSRRA